MNSKEALKRAEELTIFKNFAGSHLSHEGVDLASAANCMPPYPDISCLLASQNYFFELGEITDRGLAARVSKSLRTGEITGGAFSQELPLLYILESKSAKKYQTDGANVDLLLHYSKQYPYEPLVLQAFKSYDTQLSALMLKPSFPFSRIWIYNDWNKELILKIICRQREPLSLVC